MAAFRRAIARRAFCQRAWCASVRSRAAAHMAAQASSSAADVEWKPNASFLAACESLGLDEPAISDGEVKYDAETDTVYAPTREAVADCAHATRLLAADANDGRDQHCARTLAHRVYRDWGVSECITLDHQRRASVR